MSSPFHGLRRALGLRPRSGDRFDLPAAAGADDAEMVRLVRGADVPDPDRIRARAAIVLAGVCNR